MRRLLLMRHAKAEKESSTGKDYDRELDERGRSDAQQMEIYLTNNHLLPTFAFVSTAARAQQTWDCTSAAWPKIPVSHLDNLYNASLGDLLKIIRSAPVKDSQRLLVIAHNPGLHELALALIAGGSVEAGPALRDNLPTSGIVIIDFEIDNWNKVSFQTGRLERFVSPRLLKQTHPTN